MKAHSEQKVYLLCKFAASYFQILFNGPRMVWRYSAKKVKTEVPIKYYGNQTSLFAKHHTRNH